VKHISPYQFAVFRIAMGIYLVHHFLYLILGSPRSSHEAAPPDAALNFTHGVLPNPLQSWDSPGLVTAWLIGMLVLSVSLLLGTLRRTTCLLLWYGWVCLFYRSSLISHAGIPYVGMILLLMALVPPGEPLSVTVKRDGRHWYFPWFVFFAAWVLMAVGYTADGLDKLLTDPGWRDGTAFMQNARSPAQGHGPLGDMFIAMPSWVHQAAAWSVLAIEVLFVPLCLARRTRLVAWTLTLGMQICILAVVDLDHLAFGMVMLHMFTFDPDWFGPRRAASGRSVVFFDGHCALCNRSMKLLIDEDRARVLSFAPLQGETFKAFGGTTTLKQDLDSIVYVRGFGSDEARVLVRSGAVLGALRDVGGFWRVVSWLRFVPRPLRDRVYDFIAAHRYKWFGRYDTCRLPTPHDRVELLP
jgi:predicted DCC family thiol-disulfide oxidoreductase YuxK